MTIKHLFSKFSAMFFRYFALRTTPLSHRSTSPRGESSLILTNVNAAQTYNTSNSEKGRPPFLSGFVAGSLHLQLICNHIFFLIDPQ